MSAWWSAISPTPPSVTRPWASCGRPFLPIRAPGSRARTYARWDRAIVPTLREAGFPDIDPRSWFGIFAPRGTPKAIVEKIRNDVVRVIADPEFDAREITGKGYTSVGSTPEEFARFVDADLAYKGKMIKAAGIKIE